MKLSEFLDRVEIQSECCVVYYDEDKNERVEISDKEARDKEIRFIYSENNILFIEVEVDE